jgi:hypothetical protein
VPLVRVKALAQKFHPELGYMQHIETEPPKMRGQKEKIAYYRIAWHYQVRALVVQCCISNDKVA